ncbi:MAG TPA: hypothetical protein VMM60_04480 [Ilumatobacter sp.]|nr:hypothetical protein [Ilumatobacter sp.]
MTPVDGAPTTSLLDRVRASAWSQMALYALPSYIVSRLCVAAGAAVVAAELRVDASIAAETGGVPDVHGADTAGSALKPMINVFTSWDGRWYLDVVRNGYPEHVPQNITYFQEEARAAFFPMFPIIGRYFERVIPGGDTFAVLLLNLIVGFIAVVTVGILASEVYGERVGRTSAVLMALFPGSFVFSFAYSEAIMIALAAATLLMLHYKEWSAAGVFAALCTASRPNGVAIVLACLVAAWYAWRQDKDWRAFTAVLLAPLGFIAFQLYVGVKADETFVWFRVQSEAWGEGASFGYTALSRTFGAFANPLTSPTDSITAISVAATVLLVWFAWKAKLPRPMAAYSAMVLAMMLLPATVTARPRFLFTAFPLLIGAAWWFEHHREHNPRRHDDAWALALVSCGAGLATLTGLYGVYGAIP